MQCLATSVRELIVKKGQTGLASDAFTIAPAIKTKPSTSPASHPLYDPTTSIDIGAAEIRWRWSQTGDDPILVAAAYNAGGFYETTHSPCL
ncbi:transglycosylase SLT domain-containing protein [Rhizobium sp. SEMIA 4085]|uniref:Lytic transglycosylase-like domain-containing protein n=2 Tax=Rhizobium TaxID=379 RepID=A0A0B4X677_9HYPH|nr:lytic transglycosylase-like domain-containing protein [Rhizobium gallicum bv. gallicum R602sp]NNH32834.1 transglycosylase SLT domain-containing protein [Rhizobium sp. SEMIA 4085]TDW34088.1 transglycosylase-like protein with SLT domain [Rhizobium azibense]